MLAWIVMALLPMQGYAAATMAACGDMPAASMEAHHHGDAAGHGDASADSHHHEGDHDHGAAPECCIAPTAPAPALTVATMPAAGFIAIPFVPASERSIFPDRLKRPPRSSSL